MTQPIAALDHRDAAAAIRRLAVPTALTIASDQFLGIVDSITIGSLGISELAGITAATSIFIVFGIGIFAFGSGLRILGGQAIGAGRSERFGTIVRSSIVVPLLLAAGLALAALLAARPLMRGILPPGGPVDASAHYLMLRFLCLMPMVVTGQLIVACATAGDTKVGLRVLLAINAVHVPLVLVLALGVGTHHPLGMAGAGLSSLVAEACGLAFVLREMARRPQLRVFGTWQIDAKLVRATASLSWPDFVFLTFQIAPEPFTIALLAPQGAPIVAAFRALAIVNDASWSIPGSLGDAAEVIVAQRIGARDYIGARVFNRAALRFNLTVCGAAAALIAVFAWPLSALFTFNVALANAAALPLAVHVALTLPLKGYAMSLIAPIRASGDTRWVMAMGVATTVVATSGIACGILVLHAGLWAVPFGWTLGWIFRDVATTMRERSGDWQRRRVAV